MTQKSFRIQKQIYIQHRNLPKVLAKTWPTELSLCNTVGLTLETPESFFLYPVSPPKFPGVVPLSIHL